MNGWQRDMRWSDKFIPHLVQIVAPFVIGVARPDEDQERNTDLLVLDAGHKRIACRVRRNDALRYEGEFTIRAGRPSGTKTELAKVIEGFGDILVYGFAHPSEPRLVSWLVGDLSVFRSWFTAQCLALHALPGSLQENVDGSSSFRAFRIADLPAAFIMDMRQSLDMAA